MSIVLLGSTSGSCTLQEQAVAGTSVLTLPVGTGTVVANNVNSAIVSGTAVASTSGTSIDFTSIPSWVRRITVMFSGVSTNGSSLQQIQLGTGSTTFVTSGYGGAATNFVSPSSLGTNSYTSGLVASLSGDSAATVNGQAVFTNISSNTWVGTLIAARADTGQSAIASTTITLGATLTGIRITTVNGTDTFDAGSINILYE